MNDLSPRTTPAVIERWAVSIHTIALVAQLSFAVAFLMGSAEALAMHSGNSWLVLALGFLQAAVLLTLGWPTGGVGWQAGAIAVALAEGAQIYLGTNAYTGEHVALGTVIWGGSLALLIQVWAPAWGRRALSAT